MQQTLAAAPTPSPTRSCASKVRKPPTHSPLHNPLPPAGPARGAAWGSTAGAAVLAVPRPTPPAATRGSCLQPQCAPPCHRAAARGAMGPPPPLRVDASGTDDAAQQPALRAAAPPMDAAALLARVAAREAAARSALRCLVRPRQRACSHCALSVRVRLHRATRCTAPAPGRSPRHSSRHAVLHAHHTATQAPALVATAAASGADGACRAATPPVRHLCTGTRRRAALTPTTAQARCAC